MGSNKNVGYLTGFRSPEASTHTAADFSPAAQVNAIHCSAAGSLAIDSGNGTNITVPVDAGWNPITLTQIYKVGSSVITVWCWT